MEKYDQDNYTLRNYVPYSILALNLLVILIFRSDAFPFLMFPNIVLVGLSPGITGPRTSI
jgi:hypothetical protein